MVSTDQVGRGVVSDLRDHKSTFANNLEQKDKWLVVQPLSPKVASTPGTEEVSRNTYEMPASNTPQGN